MYRIFKSAVFFVPVYLVILKNSDYLKNKMFESRKLMPFFLLPIIKIARKIVNIPSRQNREIKYEEGSTVFRDYERVKGTAKIHEASPFKLQLEIKSSAFQNFCQHNLITVVDLAPLSAGLLSCFKCSLMTNPIICSNNLPCPGCYNY